MMACDNAIGFPADGRPEPGVRFLAMNKLKRLLRAVDEFQQQHAWLAFPVAVWKKFGDDQAGNLAALIAYSALVAIFPLLLLLITVLDIVLKNNAELKQKVLKAAVDQYPVIGPQLQGSIGHLSQKGIALAVAAIGIFIGALGVSNSLQNALNSAWEIPFARRPGFPWSWLRSAALIIVIGVGFIGTTIISGFAAGAGRVLPGAGSSVLFYAVSMVLNFGLFWLGFRLGTASEITWRQLWPGAAISAVVWQVLQAFGSYFISHQLAHAQLTLYAVQINVVRAYRLWPRSLAPPPYTEQDRHAFRLYVEKRGDQYDIVEGAGGEDDRKKTPG
jgi:membrane protein